MTKLLAGQARVQFPAGKRLSVLPHGQICSETHPAYCTFVTLSSFAGGKAVGASS